LAQRSLATPPPRSDARLVKRLATKNRLDGDVAAHSLRAGFITTPAERDVADCNIQRVSGHESTAVMHGYIRRTSLFEGAALASVMQ
jgi:integrase